MIGFCASSVRTERQQSSLIVADCFCTTVLTLHYGMRVCALAIRIRNKQPSFLLLLNHINNMDLLSYCSVAVRPFSPESLFGCLPLWTLAQVANVVEGEEETVPGGGEPREGEGGIKLLKGQFGQLGGACPGRAYAHHHGDSPQGFLHLHNCDSDAAVESSSVGARLCSSHSASRLCVCGAHHILPGAVFSCRSTYTR